MVRLYRNPNLLTEFVWVFFIVLNIYICIYPQMMAEPLSYPCIDIMQDVPEVEIGIGPGCTRWLRDVSCIRVMLEEL